MIRTTPGELMVNLALPEELRRYGGALRLDKKGLEALLEDVARRRPDRYPEVVSALVRIGGEAAARTGGFSFAYDRLTPGPRARRLVDRLRAEVEDVADDDRLDDRERGERLARLLGARFGPISAALMEEEASRGSPIVEQIRSGAKGSPANLMTLLVGDLLYTDASGRPVPVPILRGYGQGLTPTEYLAGAAGARKGVVDLKSATPKGGYLCICKGTRVRTPDGGAVPIEDLRVGDLVVGADRTGRVFPTRVTATFDNGPREAVSYRFRVGRSRTGTISIEATADHRVLALLLRGRAPGASIVEPAELPLSRCRAGFSLVPPQGWADDAYGVDEPRAWLLGLLLGNGSICGHRVTFSTGEAGLVGVMNRRLEPLGFYLERMTGHPYEWSVLDRDSGTHVADGADGPRTFRHRLRGWLYELGLLGRTSPEKFLPRVVWGWSQASAAALLNGLFTTDGWVRGSNNSTLPVIGLSLTAEPLIRDVRELLSLRFGIHCPPHNTVPAAKLGAVSVAHAPRDYVARHDLHVIQANTRNAVLRFASRVGFTGAKAEKLAGLLDGLPAPTRDAEFRYHYLGQTPLGIRPTYDIEVEHPDHLFVLENGAIVSNSKQLSQLAHRLVVTALDRDGDGAPDGPARGLPSPTDDADNDGALLAADVGPYRRNQAITPRMRKRLRALGHEEILVRSPLVGGPPEGGVYARDVGVRERGGLAPVGDFVGIAASQSISEPITQSLIGSKHCLARGTLVRMADWSVRPIEEIRPGDWVLGADGNGLTFPVRVVNWFDNGVRECYRTTFRHPQRVDQFEYLDSTLDHEILAVQRMSNCKAEAFNHVPCKYKIGRKTRHLFAVAQDAYVGTEDGLIDEPLALLVGLVIGDGCYTEAVNSVNFSCADSLLIAQLVPILAEHNLKLTKLKGHEIYYKVSSVTDHADRGGDGRFLEGWRNPIKRWLADRGMLGKYAHEKTLPDEVFRWNQRSLAALIAGLIITDGSIYRLEKVRNRPVVVSFGSTSRVLVDQLKTLLSWRFGIRTTPVKTNAMARKRPLYSIDISREASLRKFFDAIPLLGVKAAKAAELLGGIVVGKANAYYGLRRVAQEPLGFVPTYDLEVDHPDHLFVLANGLIVSNSGGVAGQGPAMGAFEAFDRLVQVPKAFGGAAHAQADGKVRAIRPAPQGGRYVLVGPAEHYVPPGQEPLVAVGDEVEAGDALSDGLPNPAEIVRHKGVGEGRRAFVAAVMDVFRRSGVRAHRRNVELVARGLIDHVEFDGDHGAWGPGDVAPYSAVEASWEPREGARDLAPAAAVGRYLERPALHYTVGTRVTPSVARSLARWGIARISAHDAPPPFAPRMVPARENLRRDPDLLTRHLGSNLQRSTLDAAHAGAVVDPAGTSFVPGLARRVDFGRVGATRGWDPSAPPPAPAPPPDDDGDEDDDLL